MRDNMETTLLFVLLFIILVIGILRKYR